MKASIGLLSLTVFVLAIITISANFIETPPLENGGKHWALLVAGSEGYDNYRHQADVSHAYHVLKDHGVPEENIVVMMVDDVANNEENPDKGVLINRPKGENVYKGVKIDYKAQHVTPEIFLAVLQGKKSKVTGKGNGRVINSGPNDHVFVNFVDHGAPGLVAFPDGELHAREFMKALKSMHQKKRYARMVIYIEACESGSMFKNLLSDKMNIYATTAANSKESSYATYYDEHLGTYLGDLYSVKWMENSDVANLNKETLQSQFSITKKETNESHVQEFGDMTMSKQPVGDYQGNTPSARNIYYPRLAHDAVDSRDVEMMVAHHKIASAESDDKRRELTKQLTELILRREAVYVQMKHIVSYSLNNNHRLTSEAMTQRTEDLNFDCYEPVAKYYSAHCRRLCKDVDAMRMMYALQNVCNVEGMSPDTVFSAIDKVC